MIVKIWIIQHFLNGSKTCFNLWKSFGIVLYAYVFYYIISQLFKPNLTKRFLKHVRDSFQLVKNPLVMFTTLLTLLLVKIFLEKMDRLKVFGKDGKATRRPNINCPENYRQMHVVFLWVYWIKLIFFYIYWCFYIADHELLHVHIMLLYNTIWINRQYSYMFSSVLEKKTNKNIIRWNIIWIVISCQFLNCNQITSIFSY